MMLLWDSSAMIVHLRLVGDAFDASYTWEANRELARDIHAYLSDRLDEHESTFDDITGIGVFAGPGSFTGLRIGIVVMNTIANTLNIPIVGETGSDWQDRALKRLSRGENERIVIPTYGSEAHITAPRK